MRISPDLSPEEAQIIFKKTDISTANKGYHGICRPKTHASVANKGVHSDCKLQRI